MKAVKQITFTMNIFTISVEVNKENEAIFATFKKRDKPLTAFPTNKIPCYQPQSKGFKELFIDKIKETEKKEILKNLLKGCTLSGGFMINQDAKSVTGHYHNNQHPDRVYNFIHHAEHDDFPQLLREQSEAVKRKKNLKTQDPTFIMEISKTPRTYTDAKFLGITLEINESKGKRKQGKLDLFFFKNYQSSLIIMFLLLL